MDAGERYLAHMGCYPVISLSLKSSRQEDFETSCAKITDAVSGEFRRHRFLLSGDRLDDSQKERYLQIMDGQAKRSDYTAALSFEEGLESNPYLEFAVITGCLRITKESIFTGLNNLKINSILSANYDEYFGFLQTEIDQMELFYEITDDADRAVFKEWYDGYTFGTKEVYNPWSVINHMETMYVDRTHAWPSPHWANTSSNRIIKTLVEHADLSTREELEKLIGGGTIEKPIHEDITYDDIEKSEDSLWNFLFFTGYLTMCGRRLLDGTPYVTLTIPNAEVRYIYKTKILDWFRKQLQEKNMRGLHDSIASADSS